MKSRNPSSSAPAGAKRDTRKAPDTDRRKFLGQLGGAAAAAVAVGTVGLPVALAQETDSASKNTQKGHSMIGFSNRRQAAYNELIQGVQTLITNGDETTYTNFIGNYSKALPHNDVGVVDPVAYRAMVSALNAADPVKLENLTLGGNTLLTDPQSGVAWDLEGADSHQLAIGTPPSVASRQIADEAVENYWMCLCRDVPFTEYGNEPLTQAAIAELKTLPNYTGPKPVNAQTLFRGFTPNDIVGPYQSQYLIQPFAYGAIPVQGPISTYQPGINYMNDPASWLAVQNGQGPFGSNSINPTPLFIHTGRDLTAWVHVDVLFESYFNAAVWLLDNHCPFNVGNPYNTSKTQTGFGTFGGPHIATLVAEVAQRALKAVWYQKWFVHRHLRPEAYGGLVHYTKTGQASFPIHKDVLNSVAVQMVFEQTGSYFMPHAYPEGCPTHPSYGQGHGTVAGACATMVKAFFDGSTKLADLAGVTIYEVSEDGTSLVPYGGSDINQITVAGELNKIAANVALGRDHAAVHWRYDYADSLPLGEQVAIRMLQDMGKNYLEPFPGFTFTKFNGETVTVGGNLS